MALVLVFSTAPIAAYVQESDAAAMYALSDCAPDGCTFDPANLSVPENDPSLPLERQKRQEKNSENADFSVFFSLQTALLVV